MARVISQREYNSIKRMLAKKESNNYAEIAYKSRLSTSTVRRVEKTRGYLSYLETYAPKEYARVTRARKVENRVNMGNAQLSGKVWREVYFRKRGADKGHPMRRLKNKWIAYGMTQIAEFIDKELGV